MFPGYTMKILVCYHPVINDDVMSTSDLSYIHVPDILPNKQFYHFLKLVQKMVINMDRGSYYYIFVVFFNNIYTEKGDNISYINKYSLYV